MANTTSFHFYKDSGLSDDYSEDTSDPIVTQATIAGGTVDITLWFGSTVTGNRARATSDPGVDNIVVSVINLATGGSAATTDVKLALSSVGLDSATGGDPLSLGTQVLSGAGNAVPVYLRVTAAAGGVVEWNNLALQCNDLSEDVAP